MGQLALLLFYTLARNLFTLYKARVRVMDGHSLSELNVFPGNTDRSLITRTNTLDKDYLSENDLKPFDHLVLSQMWESIFLHMQEGCRVN